uniref:SH3 domain binding protein 2 n=1 Tax=Homo sapiens TaxID=9606 RepID=A0AAQ5BI12_HUMAN
MAGSGPRPRSWGRREAGARDEAAAAGGRGPGPCRCSQGRRAWIAPGKPAMPAAWTPSSSVAQTGEQWPIIAYCLLELLAQSILLDKPPPGTIASWRLKRCIGLSL